MSDDRLPAMITGTAKGYQMVAALKAADEWNACDPSTSIPPDAVRAIVEAVLSAEIPGGRKLITAAVSPDAWSSLLEAFGDGTIGWDRSDVELVYTGFIHPISLALDPSHKASPPFGDKWLDEEEGSDAPSSS